MVDSISITYGEILGYKVVRIIITEYTKTVFKKTEYFSSRKIECDKNVVKLDRDKYVMEPPVKRGTGNSGNSSTLSEMLGDSLGSGTTSSRIKKTKKVFVSEIEVSPVSKK